jgi:hypothetical protein
MPEEPDDDRAAWAQGYGRVAQLTTVSLEMALPPAGGYWLDVVFHSSPGFLILGAILGFVLGLFQLMQIAQVQNRSSSRENGHGVGAAKDENIEN